MSNRTISLVGKVSAGSTKVLVSRRLGFPFVIERLVSNFALNQNRAVQISFFLSYDKETPASGEPGGVNLLQQVSSQSYCVGDDDSKTFRTNIKAEDWPTWLKIYAVNSDGFDHDIDCQILLDVLSESEA